MSNSASTDGAPTGVAPTGDAALGPAAVGGQQGVIVSGGDDAPGAASRAIDAQPSLPATASSSASNPFLLAFLYAGAAALVLFIHVLLVIAVVVILLRLIGGRKPL